MTELVHIEAARGVATITLDSPANRNALSRQLTAELAARLQAALDDPAVRIIVLTGSGTVFCSGADLKEQREANAAGGAGSGPSGLPAILTAMWHSPKPVIGRINGVARAGGLGLVAACDIAVAADTATFALSEVRIGVIPAVISVVLLPKLNPARAMELFIGGEPFSAADAVSYGLLNAAVPTDELDAAVDRYVTMLRKGAPNAVAGAKRLVRE
ncbi:MAG: enoyl-CoA hydratase/isomerase family protein, partial [Hyphomicrobiales bacterium]